MKIFILCGGFGTRLNYEGILKAKPMIRIGKDPIIFGDGSQKRSYNFAKDTARGTADAIFSKNTDSHIINIGNSKEPINLIDLAKKIIILAGKENDLEVIVKNSFENADRDDKREISVRNRWKFRV